MIVFPRSEAEFESLSEYRTISQFFRRRLKPGMRPIDEDSPLGETYCTVSAQFAAIKKPKMIVFANQNFDFTTHVLPRVSIILF
jgi:phosphatidylserine decarboxylase